MHNFPRPSRMAAAVALAVIQMGSALAQDAQKDNSNAADGLKLDSVVVTATTTKVSKMKQSVSVSGLNADQILQQAPTNAAEVLRSIPGVRAESSGGEGNANLTVRGVPISAGGARYVQLQEDGLPILQFGDFAFGTPDSFLRVDSNLDYLEVVRGGSASTMATNSPGGVINFINKTGEIEGGSVALTKGLDFDQTRYDLTYGGKINDKTRFQIGGFYRVGEGSREANFNAEEGGQIAGNITRELDNGYIRFSAKVLDDKAPTFLPVPVKTVNGQIQEVAGIDPRNAFFISSKFGPDRTVDGNDNTVGTDPRDGLRVKSSTVGVEASFNLPSGWNVTDKFRTSDNSGRFMGLFPPSGVESAAAIAGAGNQLFYGTGTRKGQAYTGDAFKAVMFNTSINDLGNTVNDLKASKSFTLDDKSKITTTAGLYTSVQNMALTWYWNQYILEAKGDNPDLLVRNPNQTTLTDGNATTTFGGCCMRDYNVQYTTTAPYLGLGYEVGNWTFDTSVRFDNQDASGYYIAGDTRSTPNGRFSTGTRNAVDYEVDEVSYSVGANYAMTKDLSLFGRTSKGTSFNADRILYGSVNTLDGNTVPINQVMQNEFGAKYRQGKFNLFATVFTANTEESNYEATTNTFSQNEYDATGVELEMSYRAGGFKVQGGLTYTDAEIAASNDRTTVGKTPRRQADVIYQITPSYTFDDRNTVGVALIGTTDSFGDDANTIKMDGFNVVNAFYDFKYDKATTISLSANNLFDQLGYTEVEGSGLAARSINGRSVKATVKYAF
ncbi:MAG: TonB-dependent receptor [Limnobacter sp.]|nr:TonB-dependent receptor [Limnobacter sp.]